MSSKSLAVFISGQGSNLEVVLRNKEKFRSLLVVSSNDRAFGLQRAKNHGVESLVLSTPIDWNPLQEQLLERGVDCIFLAGFMKILPPEFVSLWSRRLFNLHPSLLPKFKGLKAIERAFQEREAVGVTIHHVIPQVDAGEVVFQEVAVSADEVTRLDLPEVIRRTHAKEHELVQKWVDWIVAQTA